MFSLGTFHIGNFQIFKKKIRDTRFQNLNFEFKFDKNKIR